MAAQLLPKQHRHLLAGPICKLNDACVWRSPAGQTSAAHLMLFVALEGSKAELRLPATNLWINPGSGSFDEQTLAFNAQSSTAVKRAAERFAAAQSNSQLESKNGDAGDADAVFDGDDDLVDFPSVFLSFPSTKDGDWARRYVKMPIIYSILYIGF